MSAINPNLALNPERERILADIDNALVAFEQIRKGELSEFIDSVGMSDAGEADRIVVTAKNVDSSEAYFRTRLLWLCPDLIEF